MRSFFLDSCVVVMTVLRVPAMVSMAVAVLTRQDPIDEESQHITNEEKQIR
jgi:hypothetical protein